MINYKEKIVYIPFILISLMPLSLISGPAIPDLSLVVVCIIFFFYFLKNRTNFFSDNFFSFSLFFWIILVILNLITLNIYKSLGESIIFLRIILLPLIMYLWIFKNYNFTKIALIIIFICNIIVLLDTIYQFNNYNPMGGFGVDIFGRKAEIYGRLSGPFLDMVPGSYISKFFIFGFLGLNLLIKKQKYFKYLAATYLVLCGYVTFISGERMAVATFLLGMFLSIILLKNYRLIFLISTIFILSLCFLTFKTHDHYQNYKIIESKPGHLGLVIEKYDPECYKLNECSKIIRLQPKFIDVLKNFKKSAYYEAYSLSIKMIRSYPLTGIGMNNFNYACENINKFKRDRCWSHPHNFYLQWLTENGIIGFALFIAYIIFIFSKIIFSEKNNFYKNYSFIVLVVIFWPIMSTGSLLKNWHGIETFFIIGLCLSLINYSKKNI